MPYTAGKRVSTPLTRKFEVWAATHEGRKPTTLREYRLVLEQFVGYLSASTDLPMERVPTAASCPNADFWSSDCDPDWSAVTIDQFDEYMSTKVAHGTRNPSTTVMRKRKFALQGFFKYLDSRELIDRDRTRHISTPEGNPQKPKPLTDAQVIELWEHDTMAMEDRVWIGLGLFCGFRRHEMVQVHTFSFDLDARRIVKFKRKGGKSADLPYGKSVDAYRRSKKLDPRLGRFAVEWEDTLLRYLALRGDEAFLFPFREDYTSVVDTPNAINRRMRRYSDTITPHMLRHTFATNLFRMGLDERTVQDAMSHANPGTTQGYMDTESGWDQVA